MTFVKGKSGNPKGRPKRENTLSDILKREGNVLVQTDDDRTVSKGEILGEIIWHAALNGEILFANGSTLKLDSAKYIQLITLLYNRVDGAPKGSIEGMAEAFANAQVTMYIPQNDRNDSYIDVSDDSDEASEIIESDDDDD